MQISVTFHCEIFMTTSINLRQSKICMTDSSASNTKAEGFFFRVSSLPGSKLSPPIARSWLIHPQWTISISNHFFILVRLTYYDYMNYLWLFSMTHNLKNCLKIQVKSNFVNVIVGKRIFLQWAGKDIAKDPTEVFTHSIPQSKRLFGK